ncbi:hypothetical protein [uncultured Dysosmobacter sp.]|uniref:hypothetical protein n=1 Tax=uncultured Dysosmobacter sp. TaxID=2591384 RepID=UPI00261ED9FA|nr:hypothetical protein [uncultured Dysosmobacter sp.]
MQKIGAFYVYRGEWICPFPPGWVLDREQCSGRTSGIPIYKSLSDAQNAIRKSLDGSNASTPRIVATCGWDEVKKDWFLE